jgi:hypothetical protein
MPVEVVGVDLGQRSRDPEPLELCRTPVVHGQIVVVNGLMAGHLPVAFPGRSMAP